MFVLMKPTDLKIGQNACVDEILDEFEFWSPGVKKYVKLKEILCGSCRGHVFGLNDLEIGQNVCLDEIWNALID